MFIEISHGDQRLRLSTRGATILGWDPGLGASGLDGYRSGEQAEHDGFRNAVLVPWPNRTAGALWDDDGVARSTLGFTNKEGLHGLVWDAEFVPVGMAGLGGHGGLGGATEPGADGAGSAGGEPGHGGAGAGAACGDDAPGAAGSEGAELSVEADHVELVASIPDSEAFPGPIEVRVRYDISRPGELGVAVSARNDAGRPAPIGLGWHPYFKVASLDKARLWLPASQRIVVDGRLLPIAGAAAFAPIEEGVGPRAAMVANAGREVVAAPAWVPASEHLREVNLHDSLDSAFTGLHVEDGVATAYADTGLGYGLSIAMDLSGSLPAGGAGWASGPAQAARAAKPGSAQADPARADQAAKPMQAAQPAPCHANFHVFTGAPLKRDPMKSIAIEPCTTMADMLNRPEERACVIVEPGATRELNVRVVVIR